MGRIMLDAVDHLAIDVFNEVASLVVNVTARVLTPDGRINEHRLTVRPTSDRAENNASLPLSAGELVSVSVHPTGATVRRGQTFVYAFLSRDSVDRTFPNTVLVSGYLESGSGLGWPGSRVEAMADGPGAPFEVAVPNPAAGAEWSYTVPTGLVLALDVVRYKLATSAVTGNRSIELVTDNGTTRLVVNNAATAQIASTTLEYYAFRGDKLALLGGTNVKLGMPYFLLLAGDRVLSSTPGIDAGDQYTDIIVRGETWLAG